MLNDIIHEMERAIHATISITDFYLLQMIIATSKQANIAFFNQDDALVSYIVNKGFWEIGIYINNKLNAYGIVMPEFFENITRNITHFLKIDKGISFTPDNLKRCLKLVNISTLSWFEDIARTHPWHVIANKLDQYNSFEELRISFLT